MAVSPLASLQGVDAAQRRGDLQELAADRPLFAMVGPDVPAELVEAAGQHPVRLCGRPERATPLADRYLEPQIDGEARSILQRLLDGTYDAVGHLAVGHDRESSVRLFYYLRELARIEPDLTLPQLTFVDLQHQPNRTSTMYNVERLHAFAELLKTWSGLPVTDEGLRSAIDRGNERRERLRQLDALRAAPTPSCTGTEALAIIGAGMVLPSERYLPLLEGAVEELSARGPTDPREHVRVFVTGTTHDGPGVYADIEAAGAVIVGEDHDRGRPNGEGHIDPDPDPFRSLAMHHQFRTDASPMRSIQQRADATVRGVRETRAQAVVCVLRRGDDAPYWDVSEQRRRLAEDGIPLHVVELDGYRHHLEDGESARLASFLREPQAPVGEPASVHHRGAREEERR